MNRLLIVVIIGFLAILAVGFMYINNENPSIFISTGEVETFNVSSNGPVELGEFINQTENNIIYENHSDETVQWMKSLGDKYMFYSDKGYVIMDKADAGKIPVAYVLDAYFWEIFDAEIIERHSLGSNLSDVIYVNHVEYLYEQVTSEFGGS